MRTICVRVHCFPLKSDMDYKNFRNAKQRARRNRRGKLSRSGVQITAIDTGPKLTVVRVPVPLGNHCPLPMRLYTQFTASGYFSLAAGTAAYAMQIQLNTPRLPFRTVPTGLTWNNLTPASFSCPGFATLVNTNVYVQGIVTAALVEVDMVPQTVQDSVIIAGVPSVTSGVPASVGAIMTRPWSKQQAFASGRVSVLGDYPWRHLITMHSFFGIPQGIYNNDVSGSFSFSPSTDPLTGVIYQLQIETGDAANLVDALEGRFRVTYYVMLRDLSTETLA